MNLIRFQSIIESRQKRKSNKAKLVQNVIKQSMNNDVKRDMDYIQSQNQIDFLVHKKIRDILIKQANKRSDKELEELQCIIARIPFFKTKKISNPDLKEIISAFQFERYGEYEKVFNYGEIGEKLYIIIKGLVSIRIPNPTIKQWESKRQRYNDLVAWKRNVFDAKVEAAIKERFEMLEKNKGN